MNVNSSHMASCECMFYDSAAKGKTSVWCKKSWGDWKLTLGRRLITDWWGRGNTPAGSVVVLEVAESRHWKFIFKFQLPGLDWLATLIRLLNFSFLWTWLAYDIRLCSSANSWNWAASSNLSLSCLWGWLTDARLSYFRHQSKAVLCSSTLHELTSCETSANMDIELDVLPNILIQ